MIRNFRKTPTQSPSHSVTQSLRSCRIGVIGCGKMGQALIKGLSACGLPSRRLLVADIDAAARRAASRRFGVSVADSVGAIVPPSDVLILAVKPQQFPEVCETVAFFRRDETFVISIAAGITLKWLEKRLGQAPVARVMPNLPATVGLGFSAIVFGRHANQRQRAITKAIFGAVGEVIELPERLFDAFTAVSGSGPAYVFLLVHAWQQAARRLKLPPSVATAAIRQTLKGSVALLENSGKGVPELIKQVASKGGTTQAALKVLARRRVLQSFGEALSAAKQRSRALSWS